LYDQFKLKQQISIPHTQLSENLTAYLEALAESHPGAYSGSAVYYLRLWCDDNHRFLRRYYQTNSDDPVYELTPDTERAIARQVQVQQLAAEARKGKIVQHVLEADAALKEKDGFGEFGGGRIGRLPTVSR
jgi:hypothetical protein